METQRALCQVKNCCAAIYSPKHCRQIESRGGLLLNARVKNVSVLAGDVCLCVFVWIRESILQRLHNTTFLSFIRTINGTRLRENNNVTKNRFDGVHLYDSIEFLSND